MQKGPGESVFDFKAGCVSFFYQKVNVLHQHWLLFWCAKRASDQETYLLLLTQNYGKMRACIRQWAYMGPLHLLKNELLPLVGCAWHNVFGCGYHDQDACSIQVLKTNTLP